MGIRKSLWGHVQQQPVYLFTIGNAYLELAVTNFGATLVSLVANNSDNTKTNLVLGYKSLNQYSNDPFYIGATVGRFANRIAKAQFALNSTVYKLTANDGTTGNHLHGGTHGFSKKVFAVIESKLLNAVSFFYESPAGEEGYPGNLRLTVTYQLTDANEVKLSYHATTTAATPASFTNHAYFNLSGTGQPVTGHYLYVNSAAIAAAGANHIPTGAFQPVVNTSADFTTMRPVAAGMNTCFSNAHAATKSAVCAALYHPESGRGLTVHTSLPAVLVYTGDYLAKPFAKNEGICLETQFFPDTPNQPCFPSAILQPGAVYQHQTTYQFHQHFNPTPF